MPSRIKYTTENEVNRKGSLKIPSLLKSMLSNPTEVPPINIAIRTLSVKIPRKKSVNKTIHTMLTAKQSTQGLSLIPFGNSSLKTKKITNKEVIPTNVINNGSI